MTIDPLAPVTNEIASPEVKDMNAHFTRTTDIEGGNFIHTDSVYNALFNAASAMERRLKESLENYQKHPDVQANLQQLQYDLQQWNLALTTMTNINKNMGDAEHGRRAQLDRLQLPLIFDLESEEARLLLNVALMATGQNRFQSAAKILAALGWFRPGEASVAVANAILFISMKDFQGAVDYIDGDALPRFPSSAMLKAFKGMALLRMNRAAEARIPLEEAASDTVDPAAAQLAKDLME